MEVTWEFVMDRKCVFVNTMLFHWYWYFWWIFKTEGAFLNTCKNWYRGGISEYFLIQRWYLWVHGEWWYRGGIAMGTTSAAPSLWIKAAPCLHQKLIHPHHFCPFKLLSLLPALNYLMPSSSILLLQNCVIFIRWISSIWTPRVIPFLSHNLIFEQSSSNGRIV